MAKTVVITQSNYLPWRGYFDMIRSADELILLDCVQYTRRDWRNRNVIKTPNGLTWLTIPVNVKGRYHQAIDETEVVDGSWAEKHCQAIGQNYKRAACFEEVSPWLTGLLASLADETQLTVINERLIGEMCRCLEIGVPIRRCETVIDRSSLQAMDPTDRLIELCRTAGATRYLSGPAARSYMEVARFSEHGIEVVWMDYEGYPDYPQLWGDFEPKVSIVDLLLNTGMRAAGYLDKGAGMATDGAA